MKKNQAILVLISIFVVSAALGIGGTWLIKNMGSKPAKGTTMTVTPVTTAGGGASVSDSSTKPAEQTPSTAPTPAPSQESSHSQDTRSQDASRPMQKESKPQDAGQRIQSHTEEVTETVEADYGKPINEKNNKPVANITLESVKGPTPNPETRTYSLTATASGGWGQLTYYLYPTRNAQDTLVSTSGRFTNVAPSSSGKYMLVIKDRTGKELTKEIRGFTSILNKLTTQQLTTRLSKSTPDQGLGKHFASGYKINFSGIKNGDPVPTSYTQIYSNIASGYWSKVKVTAVEFNGYNKITKITVSVYYN